MAARGRERERGPGGEALRRLGRSLASDLRRAPWYREIALRGPAPEALAASCHDLRPGSAARGRAILQDRLAWAGVSAPSRDADALWGVAPPAPRWFARAHGFAWLKDLLAADPVAGSERARAYVDAWLARHGQLDEETWSPELLGRRVLSWLGAAPAVFPTDDPGTPARLEAFARQARYLLAAAGRARDGHARLTAAIGLSAAGACLPAEPRLLDTGLSLSAEEAERQIALDGGHASRSPETTAELLTDLSALSDAVAARAHEFPPQLSRAIDRMAPMLRFFQGPDGGLPAFHGGGEGDRGMIEATLARATAPARPFGFAPHTGYHRVHAADLVLIFDAGAPARELDAEDAHASPLAFELATGAGRLIVNCGWAPDQPERFREAVRATAAHSTLVVDDTSSALCPAPGAKREAGASVKVSARRNEEELGVWIESGHEGYVADYALVHQRRLYVASDGDDVRGEDTLAPPLVESGATAGAPAPFVIRFHLHPDVDVLPAPDGRSARLTMAGGEAWRFRADAAALSVEPSVYLAGGERPRESRQIVIAGTAAPDGAMDRPPNRIRWALQRLGRAAAA